MSFDDMEKFLHHAKTRIKSGDVSEEYTEHLAAVCWQFLQHSPEFPFADNEQPTFTLTVQTVFRCLGLIDRFAED